MNRSESRVIAVTGKGGTGKTALAAIMIKILTQNNKFNILAIDADSAVSLPQTLGMKVDKTVSDIRGEIIKDPEARSKLADTNIRTVIRSIVKQEGSIHLLVMGRPEGPGCFCSVNDLLKYGIQTLSKDFAITIVDGEAGPEQINRRVLEIVDTLVIVADTSMRSMQTATSIRQIAEASEATRLANVGLVINRMRDGSKPLLEYAQRMHFKTLGCVPEDKNIAECDLMGRSLLQLPNDSTSVIAVEKVLKEICL